MKKIIFFLIIVFVAANIKAQDKVKWLSFEEAIALNKETPKPILIKVFATWCGYCKKMDLETYSNQTIAKIINENFYAIALNGEEKKDIVYKNHTFKYQKSGRTAYHELAVTLMNGKLSYPTTIFLNNAEVVIERIPGYLDKESFEKILSYLSTESYKTIKWEDFEKDFKSNL
ncbi:DUF255 domain-containing protein [Polaribacter aestuariivivens]|uniref:DUF255 domain-containing protein n=1 Tax=Polaribacter aestuariivivens TaxID=2304626 RepID=A0A5S3NAC9_9FLAO|nr:DUF255 domain-containing protein [Polaribacter aestuariivivens]TMM32268.1 DUF255 domain-containing protein [Polaribacter aestuariivivens]